MVVIVIVAFGEDDVVKEDALREQSAHIGGSLVFFPRRGQGLMLGPLRLKMGMLRP